MENKTKILVIDDDEKMVNVLTRWLELKGYQVIGAHSGQDGLAIAKKEKPDLLLLDIKMPGMDGHETLKALRADIITAYLPVIMFTAQTDVDDVAKSMIAGKAMDYAVKDFHTERGLDSLHKKIQKALNCIE